MKAKLIGTKELAPEVRHFEFEVPSLSNLNFTPGQFVSIVHPHNGKEVTRAYSIASPRQGNRFALCLNRVTEGIISPYLFNLAPGDKIDIGQPLGYFTLRRPDRHAVFVATGTGIAPFRSMLMEHLPQHPRSITLLFGVRHEHGLLYRTEFEELTTCHHSFRFMPTVTRPTEAWTGRTGRVQAHLAEAFHLHGETDIANTDVYICGLKEMVDDVRSRLKQQGFERKQIIYEKYD